MTYKYNVVWIEEHETVIEVEADDEETALALAIEQWKFNGEVTYDYWTLI